MKKKIEMYLKHKRLNYSFFVRGKDLGVSFTVCGYVCTLYVEPDDTFDKVRNAIDGLIARIRGYHDVYV